MKVKVKVEKVLERIVAIAICGLVFIIPFSKAGIEIFGITAIAGWILLRGLRIKYKGLSLNKTWSFLAKSPVFLALAIFLFVHLLSCITSIAVIHSLKALLAKTIEYLLFFFIIVDLFSRREKLKILGWVVLASISLLCADGLLQYFTGFDLVRKYPLSGIRINASMESPNDFANYIILFMPVFLALLMLKNTYLRYRILAGTLFLILTFCLIFSYTRAAWFGFLAGMLFFSFLQSKKLFAFFLVIIICGVFLLPASVKNRLKQIDSMEKVTANHRIALWKESISIVEDWPILGTGLNTYTIVGPHYKIHPQGGIYPHNSYLHMSAEIGLLGLAAFLWFLWAMFGRGLGLLQCLQRLTKTKSKDYILILGLMAGLLAFLVNAFFDTTLYAIRLISIFWIMCGVLVAMCNVVEERI